CLMAMSLSACGLSHMATKPLPSARTMLFEWHLSCASTLPAYVSNEDSCSPMYPLMRALMAAGQSLRRFRSPALRATGRNEMKSWKHGPQGKGEIEQEPSFRRRL